MTTKEKIMQAACEIFPSKGFHAATLLEICDQAGVNIAAVNYHYGSKDKLYLKVWETLNERAEEFLSRTRTFDTPEEQLRQFIRVRVESVLTEDAELSPFPKLVHKEFGHPSPMHEKIMRTFMKPKHDWFKQLIARIAGRPLDDTTLVALGFCIHSPLIHLLDIQSRDVERPNHFERFKQEKDKFAETIFQFFLAGLKAVGRSPVQSDQNHK